MDFLELLKRLNANDVEYVAVGGYTSLLLGQGNQRKLFDAFEYLASRHRM